jgi:hypothetical protein
MCSRDTVLLLVYGRESMILKLLRSAIRLVKEYTHSGVTRTNWLIARKGVFMTLLTN